MSTASNTLSQMPSCFSTAVSHVKKKPILQHIAMIQQPECEIKLQKESNKNV